MGREEQLLAASIRGTIDKASSAKHSLFRVMEGLDASIVDRPHEDLQEAQETLCFFIEKAFRDSAILAERLGLPLMSDEIRQCRRSYKDLTALVETPWDVEFHSKPLADVRAFFQSLAILTDANTITGIDVFQTVLENTAKLVHETGLEPENEAAVRHEMYKLLQLVFRDASRDPPIGKLFKTYKPDFGIRSLMAAAEYKFVTNKSAMKKSLDEIYTDMKGYGASDEWRTFFAVFYMTGPFFHQKDVEAEWRVVRADLNWIPIVVNGPGYRKQAA